MYLHVARYLTTRSAGSHISQFFDLLQFLGHQKIFYKTCMCAVKVALNFLSILFFLVTAKNSSVMHADSESSFRNATWISELATDGV